MGSEFWKSTTLVALVYGIVLVVTGVHLATAAELSPASRSLAASLTVPIGVLACLFAFRLMRRDARPAE